MTANVNIVKGPNLDLPGGREPDRYRVQALADTERGCRLSEDPSVEAVFRQTKAEREMVVWSLEATTGTAGIILDPAASAHGPSVACDAPEMCDGSAIGLHLTNVFRREPWRKDPRMSPVVSAVMTGIWPGSYVPAPRPFTLLGREQ